MNQASKNTGRKVLSELLTELGGKDTKHRPKQPESSITIDGSEYITLNEAASRAGIHQFDFYDDIKHEGVPSMRVKGVLYLHARHAMNYAKKKGA